LAVCGLRRSGRRRPRDREFHLSVRSSTEEYVAEAVVKGSKRQLDRNLRILLARAEQSADVHAQELAKLGAIVDEAVPIATVPETRRERWTGSIRAERRRLDYLHESSTVEKFLALKLPLPTGLKTRRSVQ